MRIKYLIGLLCVFVSSLILGDINVAIGALLGVLGASVLVDVLTANANRRYQLTAIDGTFRATAEGSDREQVEQELARTLKSWQTNHQ